MWTRRIYSHKLEYNLIMSFQQLAHFGPMVKSHKVRRTVLTALADNEMTKVLDSATNQSKSVNEILKESKEINW
jgi:hypothetical protein